MRKASSSATGCKVFWEVYGDGEPTVLLLPTWSLVHSRQWKAQIPYLSRHFRVVTFDPRGNGRSDRPPDREAVRGARVRRDAMDVMDATGIERAVIVGNFAGRAARSAALRRATPNGSRARCSSGPGSPPLACTAALAADDPPAG